MPAEWHCVPTSPWLSCCTLTGLQPGTMQKCSVTALPKFGTMGHLQLGPH